MSRFWRNLHRATVLVYEEGGLSIAKGAAYSALLSIFPVLTTIATILVQIRARAVINVLSSLLSEVVPPGTESVILDRFVVSGERPLSLLIAASLLSLWAASGVMLSLIDGFNAVYRVPEKRTLLHHRAIAAALVFCAAIPAIGASAMIVFGERTERTVLSWLSGQPIPQLTGWVHFAGQLGRNLVAVAAVVMVMNLLYVIAPFRGQRWRTVMPGSVLATVLWMLATSAFAWYVRNIANYNVLYGSVGAAIALIAWMYVLAVIAIFGCAFNAAREMHRRK